MMIMMMMINKNNIQKIQRRIKKGTQHGKPSPLTLLPFATMFFSLLFFPSPLIIYCN